MPARWTGRGPHSAAARPPLAGRALARPDTAGARSPFCRTLARWLARSPPGRDCFDPDLLDRSLRAAGDRLAAGPTAARAASVARGCGGKLRLLPTAGRAGVWRDRP